LHIVFELMISFVSYFYNIKFLLRGIESTNIKNYGKSDIQTRHTFIFMKNEKKTPEQNNKERFNLCGPRPMVV